tara:strand:+ start:292 stop:465 length:174 start_codon:yes stop_codon:yes gene_type:complete
MANQIKKMNIDIDELTDVKVKSLTGKASYTATDLNKMVNHLIDGAYQRTNGKKLMGL